VPARPWTGDRTIRRRWLIAVAATVVGYALLTAAVVAGWPFADVDRYLAERYLVPLGSPLRWPVVLYVLIGQGVPASTVAALYAGWRARRTRSWAPVMMFALALLLLNVSVGIMKHATGRLGPKVTDQVHTVLAGGTIFPSGHAANAVVMYGLVAMIAPPARRRIAGILAVVIAVPVGLGTVAVNTHWLTDVVGGWLGGALVLLVLPVLSPPLLRLTAVLLQPVARGLLRWQRAWQGPRPALLSVLVPGTAGTGGPEAGFPALGAVLVAPGLFIPIRAGPALLGAMPRPR
jgi:membrane-associated phospholipid phosphatase